eukprot:TRINITY_DN12356_c0_g1_i1.p1 TRINITY_DN12356_c0_g1~~TRINITY_DN12356_c0_g1_i1.p1  ORF type:complete len:271 (-),score=15.13 TRINITY_DN12356_c0_g1_i1:175-987(-)
MFWSTVPVPRQHRLNCSPTLVALEAPSQCRCRLLTSERLLDRPPQATSQRLPEMRLNGCFWMFVLASLTFESTAAADIPAVTLLSNPRRLFNVGPHSEQSSSSDTLCYVTSNKCIGNMVHFSSVVPTFSQLAAQAFWNALDCLKDHVIGSGCSSSPRGGCETLLVLGAPICGVAGQNAEAYNSLVAHAVEDPDFDLKACAYSAGLSRNCLQRFEDIWFAGCKDDCAKALDLYNSIDATCKEGNVAACTSGASDKARSKLCNQDQVATTIC